jgi:hypothetical protein
MRTIEVSNEVWQAIAARGKFGETEDDVLRRVFQLPARAEKTPLLPGGNGERPLTRRPSSVPRRVRAGQRMSSYIGNGQLHVSFADGASQSWPLPAQSDKAALRSLRQKAVSFAKEHDASVGQVNAVLKTFTDNGYHLTR